MKQVPNRNVDHRLGEYFRLPVLQMNFDVGPVSYEFIVLGPQHQQKPGVQLGRFVRTHCAGK